MLPGFLACSSNNDDDNETDAVTLVSVDPNDFPEDAHCALPADGSLPTGAYVAELIDVTGVAKEDGIAIDDEFPVQSSAPVKCGTPVGFAKVVPLRSYEANVRVYPDLDDNLETVDICTVKGTAVTVVRENGECTQTLATPLVTLRCYGWAEPTVLNSDDSDTTSITVPNGAPATSIEDRTVYAHYCVKTDE
jgi:hypothetical protein